MKPPLVVAARRLARGEAPRGEFAYAVIEAAPKPEPPAPEAGERRHAPRWRTRLRSGKVVGADGAFIVECLIVNRSAGGGLLRLARPLVMADRVLVYDDGTGELFAAAVAWRRGCDVGIRLRSADGGARFSAIADSMRRRFYAVRG